MENDQLKQQIAKMREALFREKLLDGFYTQLESLVTDSNPNFIPELFGTFFSESAKDLDAAERILFQNSIDFEALEFWLFKLKGSSSSVGANKVHLEIINMISRSKQRNHAGTCQLIPNVKSELEILKSRLEPYFELLKQARAAYRRS